jgi:hypothetical protein
MSAPVWWLDLEGLAADQARRNLKSLPLASILPWAEPDPEPFTPPQLDGGVVERVDEEAGPSRIGPEGLAEPSQSQSAREFGGRNDEDSSGLVQPTLKNLVIGVANISPAPDIPPDEGNNGEPRAKTHEIPSHGDGREERQESFDCNKITVDQDDAPAAMPGSSRAVCSTGGEVTEEDTMTLGVKGLEESPAGEVRPEERKLPSMPPEEF